MTTHVPVRESIREIDGQTWLLGGRTLISRSSSASPGHLWDDIDGYFYSVLEVPEDQVPPSQALSSNEQAPFKLVYDAGDVHVVWKVGNAFLKVNIIDQPNATREHVTITAVRAMSPSFPVPEVLYHGQWDNRYYLVVSALPGRTLVDAWPNMNEATKSHYVNRIVEICNELAKNQAHYIGGVDSGQLGDARLAKFDGRQDFSHDGLLKSCVELGMDCSAFLFYHCDLGPGNLIIGPDGSLGVIDWEVAGYVPKDWIRTKFRISSGLDLDSDLIPYKDGGEWRGRVQRRLGEAGYPELAEEWMVSRGRGLELLR